MEVRLLRAEALCLLNMGCNQALMEMLEKMGHKTVSGAPLPYVVFERGKAHAFEHLKGMADFFPNQIATMKQYLEELKLPPTPPNSK